MVISEAPVSDICTTIDYGYTASASEAPVGPRFLRITDIVGRSDIDWDTVPFVEANEKILSKYRLHSGDIVIARTGASTGAAGYITDPPEAVFASYLVRFKVGESANSRYVYYTLKTDDYRNFISAVANSKSAQPNASASTIAQYAIPLPPLPEQEAIAEILGALDDKIELNRQMNATLDALAQTIFRSWFVDFDPVRAKMEGCEPFGLDASTAALFPDRLVDSLLGPIPEGWEVKALDEMAEFLNGLALQKYPPRGNDIDLPVIKIAQLRVNSTAGADSANDDVPTKYVVDDGDFLFSWSGSLLAEIWTGGRGALNQHLFKVTSDPFPQWFVYHWVQEHLEHFKGVAADKATTMGHINRRHLSEAKCAVPAESRLIDAGSEAIGSLMDLRLHNSLESRTLAELRDTLLPELISGRIRVPVAEKLAAEVV